MSFDDPANPGPQSGPPQGPHAATPFPPSVLPPSVPSFESMPSVAQPSVAKRPGMSLGTFLMILLGMGVVVLGAGLVVMTALYIRERKNLEVREAELAVAHEIMAKNAVHEPNGHTSHPDLPTVQRHVPNHSLRVLEGCSPQNLGTITDLLSEAIEQGAPLYNGGDFAGCYRTYVAASLEVERELPKTCAGPGRALASGRMNAKDLEHVSEQAWAMRDAFDGLLEVVARSEQNGGASHL